MPPRTMITLLAEGVTLVFEARCSSPVALASLERILAVRITITDDATGAYDELEIEPASSTHRSGVAPSDDTPTEVMTIDEELDR